MDYVDPQGRRARRTINFLAAAWRNGTLGARPRSIHPVLVALLVACSQKPQEPLHSLAPAPLPRMESGPRVDAVSAEDPEAAFRVESAPAFGEKLPEQARSLSPERGALPLAGKRADPTAADGAEAIRSALSGSKALLLRTDGSDFLAEVAPLLALIDDAGSELWIKHPSAPVAFKVVLRSEVSFQRWLDEPKPGKIRVIQRADGFELQTNIGKMPGPDPNGPTVPVRGGQLDIARLRRGLSRLKERFGDVPDACLVPSFGTELAQIGQALSGFYSGPGKPIFDRLCLVYPRPPR
ncbi:MAG TPA: hypothetical protein VKE49_02315 [Myxococcaceae bacterium]|nr:hypothetical protein [Myxococcaceae bacterium]